MQTKILKFFYIVLVNILVFVCLFLIVDYSFFVFKKIKYGVPEYKKNILKYNLFPPSGTFSELKNIFDGETEKYGNMWGGRKPDGIEYLKEKGGGEKSPIVIFGCSFAFGHGLNYKQTFSYKLSKILKRTVYNRGLNASGASLMLYQVKENEPDFYNQVLPSDTVIYIMIDDHYRRNLIYTFSSNDFNDSQYVHYIYKNKNFIFDSYNKPFLKNSYIYLFFHHKFADNFVKNPKNQKQLTDLQTAFIVETKKELEKHWNKKVNFVVIMFNYNNYQIKYCNILKEKLKQNNIIVIDTKDLTKEDLSSKQFLLEDNCHPNETAWDLLTPLIVKELKNKNVI